MLFTKELEYLKIPFQDIKVATKNFTTIIGEGGYGPVYTGEVSLSGNLNLTPVAVKRLPIINLFGQGFKEFLTEIHLLSGYKHPNLVSLIGYCEEGDEKILIYEYAKHGSLDKYLKTAGLCPLTWKQQMNICVDAARGLDYLHNHAGENHRIIHRDIKSANILLDHDWKAMIADFGLSKIGRANENETYLITNPGGTLGYCDPVYINTGVLTNKSDVYSFGVVLFEALCGRLFFKDVAGEQRLHVPRARRCYEEGELNEIMDLDPKDSVSVKEFSEIAYYCLHDDHEGRPSMDIVLQKLEKALELAELEEAYELQEFEEACESQKPEEALALQELVETLQGQEFVEALILQELEEALESQKLGQTLEVHKLGEILELQWFSIDENGKTQEMISAVMFVHQDPSKCEAISVPGSRFGKVAKILDASKINMQVKIRTQFLSSEVTYAAYLICKHEGQFFGRPTVRSIKYKLNNQSQSYTSYLGDYNGNGWMMIQLFQTSSLKKIVEFKVLLEEFHLAENWGYDEVIVEGIVFLPVRKFDDENIIKQEVENPPMFEIECENQLPSDYKQLIYYSGKSMMKKSHNCDVTETQEEAYSIFSKGVYIKVENDINVWFWITKSDGKKCIMLAAVSIQASPSGRLQYRPPNETRLSLSMGY